MKFPSWYLVWFAIKKQKGTAKYDGSFNTLT